MSFEHNTLLKVAVIGAGVSGLSVASLLGAAGHKVHVFEKNQKISELGAGIQISPNGFCVLNKLGVAEDTINNSVRNNSILICDYYKGKNCCNSIKVLPWEINTFGSCIERT